MKPKPKIFRDGPGWGVSYPDYGFTKNTLRVKLVSGFQTHKQAVAYLRGIGKL